MDEQTHKPIDRQLNGLIPRYTGARRGVGWVGGQGEAGEWVQVAAGPSPHTWRPRGRREGRGEGQRPESPPTDSINK